jgi:hypothetical protein
MDPVAIANLALTGLGSKPITSFDDPQKAAQLIKASFTAFRDVVLEARDWTFATVRFFLAPADVDLPSGFRTAFEVPPNVLRVVRCAPGSGFPANYDLEWVLESGYILTAPALSSLEVKAIVQEEDPAKWSPGFCIALAARIAAELCGSLTENRARSADLWNEYQAKIRDAAANDGRQGRSQVTVAHSISDRRR